MMLSLSKALLAAAVLSLSTGSAYAAKRTADAEDAKFWERHLGLLKDGLTNKRVLTSMSITPAPTPPPTPPPTPAPVIPPECKMEVDISCKVPGQDGRDCTEIQNCDPIIGSCSCDEQVCYTYETCNVGGTDMDVIEARSNSEDLLSQVNPNPVPIGECATIESCITVDVCVGSEVCTEFSASAGDECKDSADYCFTIEPPPPPPECKLDVGVDCTLSSGESCNVATPNVVPCTGRPLMMGMLFNGGDCSQSQTSQEEAKKFACEDFNGGPSAEDGAEYYVFATAQKDSSVIYYNGPVTVGEVYRLEDQNAPGTRFAADQTVKVYSSADMSDESLVQLVDYHSSCSKNLDLKNRFGASQIVEWYNEEQGLVTCFSNISYDLTIAIPLEIEGNNLTLSSLVIRTNFDGTKDLTEQVAGKTVPEGGSLNVQFDVNIDLAIKARYTFLTSISGTTDKGVPCSGVNFDSILIGYGDDVTGTFPTQAPGRLRKL